MTGLTVAPCTLKLAYAWNREVHRKLKKIQGAMWAVSVHREEEMIGVSIVGRPIARAMEGRGILCVLRVAVLEGHKNACSKLYGACARAVRSMGATGLVTYTHQDEPGTSLKAAGWICDGLTGGGEWNSKARPRQPSLFSEKKLRWWAPWSVEVSAMLREAGLVE